MVAPRIWDFIARVAAANREDVVIRTALVFNITIQN